MVDTLHGKVERMVATELRGYSERGMINAVAYEIALAKDGSCLCSDLLSSCTFPFSGVRIGVVSEVRLRVEQSFSDFGDIDLLLLLKAERTHALFVEAKVKTFRRNSWSIYHEWNEFNKTPAGGKKSRSNLFVQLYRKMKLMKHLQTGNPPSKDGVDEMWSLGENRVIQNAARELTTYCWNPWYLALVPDEAKNMGRFFDTELKTFKNSSLPDWNINNLGFLTWKDIYNRCQGEPERWPITLAHFDYNEGQIMEMKSLKRGLPPFAPNDHVIVRTNGMEKRATIKNRGQINTRVTLEDGNTIKVSNSDIHEA